MLITFKSKAYPNVLMVQEHAQRILDLLHKDPERGVITAEEAPKAVQLLEHEIDESRKHQATDEVEQDVKAHHGEVEDAEHEPVEVVSFSTRAYPLLEMLRAARDQGTDVLWGV
jgi:polyhydroxyalkanoate synthesis regulator phasin